MTAGERLREKRGNRTVQEVADSVGITRSALTNYENDERVPKDKIKVKLAKYYHTTVQKLFFSDF